MRELFFTSIVLWLSVFCISAIILVEEKQRRHIPNGLKRWNLVLIVHDAFNTFVSLLSADPAVCRPVNFINLFDLYFVISSVCPS